jgi:hypothetical protein
MPQQKWKQLAAGMISISAFNGLTQTAFSICAFNIFAWLGRGKAAWVCLMDSRNTHDDAFGPARVSQLDYKSHKNISRFKFYI